MSVLYVIGDSCTWFGEEKATFLRAGWDPFGSL